MANVTATELLPGIIRVTVDFGQETPVYTKYRVIRTDGGNQTLVELSSKSYKKFSIYLYNIEDNNEINLRINGYNGSYETISTVTIPANERNDMLVIWGRGKGCSTEFEADIQKTHNFNYNIVTTLGSKYPFIIRNGNLDYLTGSITAKFLSKNDDGSYDEGSALKSINTVKQFLCDGTTKIIRMPDCGMVMAQITGTEIVESYEGTKLNKSIEFSYTEVGEIPDYSTKITDAIANQMRADGVLVYEEEVE